MTRLTKKEIKKIADLLGNTKRNWSDGAIAKKTGIPKEKVIEITKYLTKKGIIEDISPIKLPKKITLLNQIFDIERARTKSDCWGEINYKEKKIIIDDRLNDKKDKQEIMFILIHEMSHYFINYYHLEDSEALSNALTQFIFTTINQLGFEKRR